MKLMYQVDHQRLRRHPLSDFLQLPRSVVLTLFAFLSRYLKMSRTVLLFDNKQQENRHGIFADSIIFR